MIIEDLQEAGWSMKKPRENEKISDLDLRHIFDKVDLNQDSYVNRMVIPLSFFHRKKNQVLYLILSFNSYSNGRDCGCPYLFDIFQF